MRHLFLFSLLSMALLFGCRKPTVAKPDPDEPKKLAKTQDPPKNKAEGESPKKEAKTEQPTVIPKPPSADTVDESKSFVHKESGTKFYFPKGWDVIEEPRSTGPFTSLGPTQGERRRHRYPVLAALRVRRSR